MIHHGARPGRPVELGAILAYGLEIDPDGVALVTVDGEDSWRALDEASSALAAGLARLGIAPGDRVASFLPNSRALFLFYLATLRAGFVAVPLNYRYTAYEIDHALEVSGARVLIYAAEREAEIAASTRAPAADVRIVDRPCTLEATPLDDLLATPAEGAPAVAAGPQAPAIIYFTSGSTGPAKGVTHSRESFAAMVAGIAHGLQIAPQDRFMTGGSASHVGGSITALGTWSRGAMVISPRVGHPPDQLELMQRWRPTLLLTLPASLIQLHAEAGRPDEAFASLRRVMTSGDTLPKSFAQAFLDSTDRSVQQTYGLTEMPTAFIDPTEGRFRPGSIGRVGVEYLAEVRDEAGRPTAVGKPGRLWLSSPTIRFHYWESPQATAAVHDVHGWFDTGDIISVDGDGYGYFQGRRKQIIVHDGSNIFPSEVEDALVAHPAVAVAGVVGVQDPVHGENVRAFVELKADAAAPTASGLIAFARERVGYKAPEEIVFVDRVLTNATGKVDRGALKQRA